MAHPSYYRRFLITVAGLILACPLLLWGSWKATQEVYNSPPDWVPAEFDHRRDYLRFVKEFEADDSIIISWDGCTVDDKRLEALGKMLQSPEDPAARRLHEKLYDRVSTGYGVLRAMTEEPLGLSRRQALRRLRGSLVGPDGQTSCAVVVPTLYAAYHREEAIEHLLDVAQEAAGLPRDRFYLVGAPVDGYIIDRESIRSLNYYALPSALIALGLCWLCLRSWRFTLVIVLAAVLGQLIVLSLTYYLGYTMNAVLIIMPALVLVLSVSAGVHLVNYYYDQLRLGAREQAPSRAIAAGWLPCTLAALTTAIGVASLLVSDIEPIRAFSIISVIGVLSTVGLLFLMLPGAMQRWLPRPKSVLARSSGADAGQATRRPSNWQARAASLVCRHATLISLASLGLMVVAAWGLTHIRTSVNIRGLFVSDSRIIGDYQWLEQNLGPIVPLEVVIRFDKHCPLDVLERLELVRDVQRGIEDVEHVGGVTSAASFLPDVPRYQETMSTRGIIARTRFRRALGHHLSYLDDINYLHRSEEQQSWRISARVPALKNIDYGHFLEELRGRVAPVLQDEPKEVRDGIGTTYTGVMPLVDEAQRVLLRDLFASFLTAFAVVAVVMMLVLRSVPAGALAMLPNAFPAVILFGAVGWGNWPVDIGSVMTASVALGIAVDGTLHFLTWYRRETAAGQSPQDAVGNCYQHCATALVQATIICGFGLLVYALSDFVPTQRFAWMMLLLLSAALVGDLILLPALLVGPLGKAFLRRPRGRARP